MCAALAWSGLISQRLNASTRGPIERLVAFWRDLEAATPFQAVLNYWSVWSTRLPITAEISPYVYSPMAEPALRELLRTHVELDAIPNDTQLRALPKLLVGATDILHGGGQALPGETLTYDDIVASAAIPPLYRAVEMRGSYFWDGLFSRNPPVREFTDLPLGVRPDELWVIRINPIERVKLPTTTQEIADRRNELAGNLALDQELYFIHKVNELLARHPQLEQRERYQPIVIREIGLDRPDLDYPSKLDRSPELIEELLHLGRNTAPQFFQPRSLKKFQPVRESLKERPAA